MHTLSVASDAFTVVVCEKPSTSRALLPAISATVSSSRQAAPSSFTPAAMRIRLFSSHPIRVGTTSPWCWTPG